MKRIGIVLLMSCSSNFRFNSIFFSRKFESPILYLIFEPYLIDTSPVFNTRTIFYTNNTHWYFTHSYNYHSWCFWFYEAILWSRASNNHIGLLLIECDNCKEQVIISINDELNFIIFAQIARERIISWFFLKSDSKLTPDVPVVSDSIVNLIYNPLSFLFTCLEDVFFKIRSVFKL